MLTLKEIHFHGKLADHFGREPIKLAVGSGAQAKAWLSDILPGFNDVMAQMGDVRLMITTGRKDKLKAVTERDYFKPLPNLCKLHLVPNAGGAGVELAVMAGWAAAGTTSALVIGTAINMVAGTVLSMAVAKLSPKPKEGTSGVDTPSRILSTPFTYQNAGLPVPMIFGTVLVDSTLINQVTTSRDIGLNE